MADDALHISDQEWRSDIEYLRKELPHAHNWKQSAVTMDAQRMTEQDGGMMMGSSSSTLNVASRDTLNDYQWVSWQRKLDSSCGSADTS